MAAIDQLIQALTIFKKYLGDDDFPTHCEHDTLMVMVHTEDEVSEEDRKALKELGFSFSEDYDCWKSFRFGSA
jgi:hypothetical protein